MTKVPMDPKRNTVAPSSHEDIVWILSNINTRLTDIDTQLLDIKTSVTALTTDAAEHKGAERAKSTFWGIIGGLIGSLGTYFAS